MFKGFLYCTLIVTVLLAYQNCAMSDHLQYASSDFSSLSFGNDCDAPLKKAFAETYYPVFRNKCTSCHDTGAGFGHFANSDFATAFAAFQSVTRTRVEHNFVNAGHQPGRTGPENQPTIDAALPAWTAAEAYNKTCKGGSTTVVTTNKVNAGIYTVAAGTYQRIEWNLNSDVNSALAGKIPVSVGIDIRRAIANGQTVGYEFRNPTARLNSGTTTYQLQGMHVVLNNVVLNDVTTYSFLNFTVATTTNTIMQSGALGLIVTPIANTDTFALQFDKIADASGQVIAPPGPTPAPTPTPTPNPVPTSVTFTQLNSTDPTLGIFKSSCVGCHNATNKQGSLDLTNYAEARLVASTILQRMTNAANPMPRSGLLSSQAQQIVGVWVANGAPQ